MDHIILADESETIKIQMKTIDWGGKLIDLYKGAIQKQSTRQYKDSGPSTMENSIPQFYWSNWIT
jgi:hypothetical protein